MSPLIDGCVLVVIVGITAAFVIPKLVYLTTLEHRRAILKAELEEMQAKTEYFKTSEDLGKMIKDRLKAVMDSEDKPTKETMDKVAKMVADMRKVQ